VAQFRTGENQKISRAEFDSVALICVVGSVLCVSWPESLNYYFHEYLDLEAITLTVRVGSAPALTLASGQGRVTILSS